MGGFAAHFYLPSMKQVYRISLGLALILGHRFPALAQTQAASPPDRRCTLRIHVDGLRNTTGVVGTELFTSPAGWPEDLAKSFRHGAVTISADRTADLVLTDIPPGDYGVVALHDENRNRKLDRNLIGLPKEGFGFANNPHVGLSAPPFRAAIVHVGCPATETTIHIIYK